MKSPAMMGFVEAFERFTERIATGDVCAHAIPCYSRAHITRCNKRERIHIHSRGSCTLKDPLAFLRPHADYKYSKRSSLIGARLSSGEIGGLASRS